MAIPKKTLLKCEICEKNEPIINNRVCTKCFDAVLVPAHDFVATMKPDDPIDITWHGWALREAFIAGVKHQMKREEMKITTSKNAQDRNMTVSLSMTVSLEFSDAEVAQTADEKGLIREVGSRLAKAMAEKLMGLLWQDIIAIVQANSEKRRQDG